MNQHKFSGNLAKWQLDETELSREDKQVLKIVNFPFSVTYGEAVQKRIRRQYANGGFIDKSNFDINDVKYMKLPADVAAWDIKRTTPQGKTPEEIKRSAEHLERTLKVRAQQFIYFDAESIEEEKNLILTLYSSPKPTPSMKAEPKPKAKPKPRARKKAKAKPKAKGALTEKQKETAINKLSSGEMDLKECAAFLGVTQTALKPLLKTLKNS